MSQSVTLILDLTRKTNPDPNPNPNPNPGILKISDGNLEGNLEMV